MEKYKNIDLFKLNSFYSKEITVFRSIFLIIFVEYFLIFFMSSFILTIIDNCFFFNLRNYNVRYIINFLLLITLYIIIIKITLSKYLSQSNTYKAKKLSIKQYIAVLFLIIGLYLILTSSLHKITSYIDDFYFNKNLNLNNNINNFNLYTPLSILGIIYTDVIFPFIEEIIYRKIILSGLLKKYSKTLSIALSVLLFSLSHASLPQIINVIPLGIVLGIIFVKTNNIYLSILAHIIYNQLVTYFSLLINLSFNNIHYLIQLILGTVIFIVSFRSFLNLHD